MVQTPIKANQYRHLIRGVVLFTSSVTVYTEQSGEVIFISCIFAAVK